MHLVSYDACWPDLFEKEAGIIGYALGDHGVAIHHVGSTSVPGLMAKPIIDILGVVKDGNAAIQPLQSIGYSYEGSWNIPFQFGFKKKETILFYLHVFEEQHPEIELNLVFRNHLRNHPKSLAAYASLKKNLSLDKNAFLKKMGIFF
jgi:GrpB-like predicted nucleotidyltransferase (UPF0157 family)